MEKVIILVLSILCFACNANASIERSKKALAYLNCPDHQIEHIANVLSKIPNKKQKINRAPRGKYPILYYNHA